MADTSRINAIQEEYYDLLNDISGIESNEEVDEVCAEMEDALMFWKEWDPEDDSMDLEGTIDEMDQLLIDLIKALGDLEDFSELVQQFRHLNEKARTELIG